MLTKNQLESLRHYDRKGKRAFLRLARRFLYEKAWWCDVKGDHIPIIFTQEAIQAAFYLTREDHLPEDPFEQMDGQIALFEYFPLLAKAGWETTYMLHQKAIITVMDAARLPRLD